MCTTDYDIQCIGIGKIIPMGVVFSVTPKQSATHRISHVGTPEVHKRSANSWIFTWMKQRQLSWVTAPENDDDDDDDDDE